LKKKELYRQYVERADNM